MEHKDFPMPYIRGNAQINHCADGSIRFRLSDSNGEVIQTRYPVFSGIDLIYNDIHMPRSGSAMGNYSKNMIEIDHCREGRLECQVEDDYFYLAPGDVAIHRLGETVREEVFPNRYYQGITIQIDLNKSPKCLTCLLEDVDVEPAAIAQKFQLDKNLFFALRQLPSIEHIFSELYAVPDSIRKGYMKVKILEIFLFLSSLEPEKSRLEQRHFSETQVTLAKAVCRYLTEQLDKRITTAELSEYFGVSATQIKNSFDGVYGTSIHTYMRSQRMQSAAKLLRQTDRTVLDIAGQFGYDNASKFAGAFRKVMGVTPMQYRNGLYHAE